VKLEYQGQERITASKDAVWAFVNDPDQVSACLPDVVSVTVKDPTHFDAVVRVGVGPVRGNLTFKFELQPDVQAQRMNMKISGGGLGSALDLTAGADIRDAGDEAAPATLLDWKGEAVMRGPVAAVGGRVLDAQARRLIAQTFANVAQRVSS
jgi:carbon monoxide dehydrogenase subunit G